MSWVQALRQSSVSIEFNAFHAMFWTVVFQPLIRIRVPAIKFSVDKVHITIFELLLFRPWQDDNPSKGFLQSTLKTNILDENTKPKL